MGLMDGKRGVIFGVANDKSIAWGIAQQLREAGAELAFTYLNESLEKRVRPLAESLGSSIILPCDVASDEEIQSVFDELKKQWGSIDFVVHAVAFARHAAAGLVRDGEDTIDVRIDDRCVDNESEPGVAQGVLEIYLEAVHLRGFLV